MRKWLLAGGCLAALGLAACTETYLGRFVRLTVPDVEDYRSLPTREVKAASGATGWTEAWRREWPSEIGLSFQSRSLSGPGQFDALLEANGTTAFLVIENGKLVDERYFGGSTRESLFKVFSISKSVLSALLGIAIADGIIRPTDTLGDHLPDIANPRLADVRLSALLDNVSGFAYERGNLPWKDQPRMYYTTDVRGFAKSVDFAAEPGTRFDAEDISPLLLGIALEAALRKAKLADNLSDYAERRLWQPMGAAYDAKWVIDRDGDGMEKTESGFVARAVDMALFGQLYLNGGAIDGVQIVPRDWVDATMSLPAKGAPNLFDEGFLHNLWWGRFVAPPGLPDIYANGHYRQRIYLSRNKRLVLVRFGRESGEVDWTALLATIAEAWPSAPVN
jgi:CubicO group peptidase (beta-lactamase class C family)